MCRLWNSNQLSLFTFDCAVHCGTWHEHMKSDISLGIDIHGDVHDRLRKKKHVHEIWTYAISLLTSNWCVDKYVSVVYNSESFHF